jgi:hypothetical protein
VGSHRVADGADVGSTKTLTLVAPLVDGFDSEDDALMAGMRYALDSLGG